MRRELVPQFTADSTTTTVADATPQNIAIPDAANGEPAKYVMVVSDVHAAIKPCLVADATAFAALARIPADEVCIINVSGNTHMRMSGAGGGGEVTLTPLENQ